MGPRRFVDGRDRHQPVDHKTVRDAAPLDEQGGLFGSDPRLLRLATGIHLDQQVGPASLLGRFGGDRRRDPVAIEAVDRIEQPHRVRRLVRLQRPDQVEPEVRIGLLQRRPFPHRLLDTIFAELPVPGVDKRPYRVGVEQLADRDQPDAAGGPPCRRFCVGHAPSDFGQAAGGVGHGAGLGRMPRKVKRGGAG